MESELQGSGLGFQSSLCPLPEAGGVGTMSPTSTLGVGIFFILKLHKVQSQPGHQTVRVVLGNQRACLGHFSTAGWGAGVVGEGGSFELVLEVTHLSEELFRCPLSP